MQAIIYCPLCKKRLLDLEWTDIVVINIKCCHCKSVVAITQNK